MRSTLGLRLYLIVSSKLFLEGKWGELSWKLVKLGARNALRSYYTVAKALLTGVGSLFQALGF